MPTWGEILKELSSLNKPGAPPDLDFVRRRYLIELHQVTKRAIILYSTKWTQAADASVSPSFVSIVDEDLQGLMEVVHGIHEKELDLILHSPGGSLEAAEALVSYLRSKFTHIRVIVPQLAMSAATMIACAADKIVLGKHSFLGPTDPQFILNTPIGPRMVSVQDILDQFELAKEECKSSAKLGAWLPMLNQYGPDLIVKCQHANAMAKTLVKKWLNNYMFKRDKDRKTKSESIGEWLADHKEFKSHGRHIPRHELEAKNLKIIRLEKDQKIQDLVLSIFHATAHTFTMSPAVKIIENHLGKAFIKQAGTIAVPRVPPKI